MKLRRRSAAVLLAGLAFAAPIRIVHSLEPLADTVPAKAPRREAHLEAGNLSGRLLDNVANFERSGSGFNPFFHSAYPGKPIFRLEYVGLNFEHIFNGAAADRELSMFTPRKDPCEIIRATSDTATLRWPAESSAWRIGCEMTYRLSAPNMLDMVFSATPTVERFPLGYVAFMWAGYMSRTRERAIRFFGRAGEQEGWIAFGEDLTEGFETGTVSFDTLPDLPHEEGAQTLNLIENPTKKFLKPVYYGLLDGDQDLETDEDTLVYILMFDQSEPIRFSLWNFIRDSEGRPDPHSPAWDWQFVIRNPEVGKTYRYRARLVIEPFDGQESVARRYSEWMSGW